MSDLSGAQVTAMLANLQDGSWLFTSAHVDEHEHLDVIETGDPVTYEFVKAKEIHATLVCENNAKGVVFVFMLKGSPGGPLASGKLNWSGTTFDFTDAALLAYLNGKMTDLIALRSIELDEVIPGSET